MTIVIKSHLNKISIWISKNVLENPFELKTKNLPHSSFSEFNLALIVFAAAACGNTGWVKILNDTYVQNILVSFLWMLYSLLVNKQILHYLLDTLKFILHNKVQLCTIHIVTITQNFLNNFCSLWSQGKNFNFWIIIQSKSLSSNCLKDLLSTLGTKFLVMTLLHFGHPVHFHFRNKKERILDEAN